MYNKQLNNNNIKCLEIELIYRKNVYNNTNNIVL